MTTTSGRLTATLLLSTVLGTSAASAQPIRGIESLLGTWRVAGVGVAPSPVQAVGPDDPPLMGATLVATRARLSWRAPHRSTPLDVVCVGPRVVRGAVSCRKGSFGPPGSRLVRNGRSLMLPWYDGAILRLTPVPVRRHAPG